MKCENCGKEFLTSPKNNSSTLCTECHREVKNEINRTFMRKVRQK